MPRFVCYVVITIILLISCDLYRSPFPLKKQGDMFLTHLLKGQYDSCMAKMVTINNGTRAEKDSMRVELEKLRASIVNDLGFSIDNTVLITRKEYENAAVSWLSSKASILEIDLFTKQKKGSLQFVIDDRTLKVINYKYITSKPATFSFVKFWFFTFLVLSTLVFNFYIVWIIARSNLSKKVMDYLVVILFNVPLFFFVVKISNSVYEFKQFFGKAFQIDNAGMLAFIMISPIAGIRIISKLRMLRERRQKFIYRRMYPSQYYK